VTILAPDAIIAIDIIIAPDAIIVIDAIRRGEAFAPIDRGEIDRQRAW